MLLVAIGSFPVQYLPAHPQWAWRKMISVRKSRHVARSMELSYKHAYVCYYAAMDTDL